MEPKQNPIAVKPAKESESKKQKEEEEHINEQIQQQLEEIRKEEENRCELITKKESLDTQESEYSEAPMFLIKINYVKTIYNSYRHLRRDGSCFYRSYLFRLLEHLNDNKNDIQLWTKIEQKFKDGQTFMTSNGFDKIVAEDFCEGAVELQANVKKGNFSDEDIRNKFLDLETSNLMVMFLRFQCSAYIQQNKDLFAYYIGEDIPVEWFCQTEVEPQDRDADQVIFDIFDSPKNFQVQIIAVHNYFETPMLIVYLDNSPSEKTHDFKQPEDMNQSDIWMKFLYRPGHYDLIYK